MNLTLTSLNAAAGAKPAATATPAAANEAAAPLAPAQANGSAVPAQAEQQAAPQAARAFAQWLGLAPAAPAADIDTAAAEAAASDIASGTAPGTAPAAETPADEQQPAAESVLLGAMAMPLPLLPVAQATLAAVVAALPGAPAPKDSKPAADTGISLPAAELALDAGKAGAFAAPAPASLAPVQAAPAAATPASLATAAPAAESGAGSDALAAADAAQEHAAPAAERAPANSFGVAAPAPGNARSTETVALSGPPTAWRQTLQEALGERLQVQVGKGAEQAVIRLEPPMLGRVEIAIRHSAGSLEVNISATHGEVLRQLQTVSENLRNDLAQRQFMDVAVNVAPAPRGAAATPMFAGDGSGRGRQQDGSEQEQTPGNALAEAHTGAAPFSLNGRA